MSDLWADLAEGDMGVKDDWILAVAGVLRDLELNESDGVEVLIRILAWVAADYGNGVAMMAWLASEIQEAEQRLEREGVVLQ